MNPLPADASEHDVELLRLVEDLTDRLQSGECVDLAKCLEEHPEFATELPKLLPALTAISDLGDSSHELNALTPDFPVPPRELGDFRIRREIGRGGMGIVYEAIQTSLGRRVALKVLPFAAIMDHRQLQRFKTEAQAAATLHHQNIVPVYGIGCDRGVHYYAMQYIEGQTMAVVIRDLRHVQGLEQIDRAGDGGSPASSSISDHPQKRTFTDTKAIRVHDQSTAAGMPSSEAEIRQPAISSAQSTRSAVYLRGIAELGMHVAEALEHAHEEGIVHRDVKPSNLILDELGKVWVTDFGLARIESDPGLTMSGDVVGTLRYMSPEQALAKQTVVDHRTDIYALGVTIYELLTLQPAFSGQDRRELLRQIAFEEPLAPRRLNNKVPADLETIVLKAMAKDPVDRYATAHAFAVDLGLFLKDKPIRARRPTSLQRLAKWSKRHQPIVWSTCVASAIVLLVVAVGASLLATKQQVIADQERDRRVTAEKAKDTEAALREQATELLAGSYVDRAQSLCEQGEIGRGILWLAHALEIAPADSTDLSSAIRTSLAAWHRELHPLAAVLQHPRGVRTVALTSDGSQVVTGCDDGLARLWDISAGRPIGKALPHGDSIRAVAVSPDGARIATAGGGSVRLWNAGTREAIGGALQDGSIRATSPIRFSPDGTFLLTGATDHAVRRWNARTGTPMDIVMERQGQQPYSVRAIRFCSNGLRIAVTTDRRMHQVFDGDSGTPVGPKVTMFNIFAVALSVDGSRLATAGSDGIIQLWDIPTGKPAIPPIARGAIATLEFNPDGSRLASGGLARTALLWDTTTGTLVGAPLRQQATVRTVAFSDNGRAIATGNAAGIVRVWHATPRESPDLKFESEDEVVSAMFTPAGLRVLTSVNGKLQLRDASTGDAVGQPFAEAARQHMGICTPSPDASQLFLLRPCYAGRLIDLATGTQLEPEPKFPHDPGRPHIQGMYKAVFSPEGSRIVAGFDGGLAQLRDAATLRLIGEVRGHRGAVRGLAFTPDGSRLLTGSYDGTTQLWDATTLKPIGEPLQHQSEVKDLAVSPDGARILIGFADGTVRLWTADTLEPIGTPLQYVNIVCSVAFSPDGSRLLACSLDSTARLWDTVTLKPIGPPLAHACRWPEGKFSPDGAHILLTDNDRTVQLWDAPPGPIQGSREQIARWAEVVTGLELHAQTGETLVLDESNWRQRRRRLATLGGTPVVAPIPAPLPKPKTAFSRAMAFAVRGRDRVEAALWEEANADFDKAIELSGNSPILRGQIACWTEELDGNQHDE